MTSYTDDGYILCNTLIFFTFPEVLIRPIQNVDTKENHVIQAPCLQIVKPNKSICAVLTFIYLSLRIDVSRDDLTTHKE